MFLHLARGGGGGMTVYTIGNNHLSICFPLFPSLLLQILAPQEMHYLLKMKNSNISLIIKHFNMSLWLVKKHKWQAKICLACQKIKKMEGYNFFLFRALLQLQRNTFQSSP